MHNTIIRGGLVIDPSNQTHEIKDLYIKDGLITTADLFGDPKDAHIINAQGKVVTPGFIEIHAHLREPGFEGKETLETGSRAAIQGGYTTVCAMPNTNPTLDRDYLVNYIKLRSKEIDLAKIEVIGAVSKGLKGEEMAEIGKMRAAGAVAFSDDGMPVMNAGLMRNILEYSIMFDAAILVHEEDHELSKPGVMNEGAVATRLGLAGVPGLAEEVMIARDILLAEESGAHLHICHVSTAKAVDLVRQAKAAGIHVTCEVTPHHLLLSDALFLTRPYDTNLKMAPPLRTQTDVDACIAGLLDGTIDAIATDHAPHKFDEKDVEFNYAPNGITGLETAFAAINSSLIKSNLVDLETVISKLTYEPAQLFGLDRGTLQVGSAADLTMIDLDEEWQVTPASLATKGKNTPWLNQTLTGKVKLVMVDGVIKYQEVN